MARKGTKFAVLNIYYQRTPEPKITHNRSLDLAGQMNSVNTSVDDRFLATGNCQFNPNTYISYPSALQIWETHTGRCINQIKPVDCGFNSHGRLQWNQTFESCPYERRYHLALNTQTCFIQI